MTTDGRKRYRPPFLRIAYASASSMLVPVMNVRPVGMRMSVSAVTVRMLVQGYLLIVRMRVMQVVVPVQMGVFSGLMIVIMLVPFGGEQSD